MLDAVIKSITRSRPSATVREDDEAFSAVVHFGNCDTKDYHIEVRPLLSRKAEDFSNDIVFSNLSITQLSEFYILSVSDGQRSVERVIIIPTAGLPEAREKAVISSVVSNRDCFYRYIAFLLGDDSILSVLESNVAEEANLGAADRRTYQVPALYEKMLQTAAVAPEKFKGIEYLMKTIAEDGIIPEDFQKLYQTFKKAVKLNG